MDQVQAAVEFEARLRRLAVKRSAARVPAASRTTGDVARFFVDENALPVARALAAVRRDVVYPGHDRLPEVPLGAPDAARLEEVSTRGAHLGPWVSTWSNGRLRRVTVATSLGPEGVHEVRAAPVSPRG